MQHFRFGEELVSSGVPCLGPGAPKSGFRVVPWLRGALFFSANPHYEGELGGEKMVERHSDSVRRTG